MKEVGLYIMMHILKYTFVIGILSDFYIYELLKKVSITVLIKTLGCLNTKRGNYM